MGSRISSDEVTEAMLIWEPKFDHMSEADVIARERQMVADVAWALNQPKVDKGFRQSLVSLFLQRV